MKVFRKKKQAYIPGLKKALFWEDKINKVIEEENKEKQVEKLVKIFLARHDNNT